MPNSSMTPIPPEFVKWLRQYDNPFDVFVLSDANPAGLRWHVPEVNGDVFDHLKAGIARYQLNERATAEEVPYSGVLFIFGKRGAGKTHLRKKLEADAKALILTPSDLETHRLFPEFLLVHLVQHLLNENAREETGSLFDLANWLARKVLIQALYALTERDWLALNLTHWTEIIWRGVLGFGTEPLLVKRDQLITCLEQSNQSIREIFQHTHPSLDTMRQLALHYVQKTQRTRIIEEQIRYQLYAHLIHFAFSSPSDDSELFEFLRNGFTTLNPASSPPRQVLVSELFRALIELFAAFGKPVVFAFDDLELLLKPRPDEELCRYFFTGLAEVVNLYQGVPFFVFAEYGHWQQARQYMDNYIADRFIQGVPTRGFGSQSELRLPDVRVEEIRSFIQHCM